MQAQAVILAAAIGAQVLAGLFAERRASEARLARANVLLERERDNRLLNAQAVTIAIAHEIRQPLTAIVTNADTALRWLERTPPDHDEAREALACIKEDGYRASDVFEGNPRLVREERHRTTTNRFEPDCSRRNRLFARRVHRHGVVIRYELTSELPPVIGHGIQLREVVFNLVNDAVEAMASTTSRSRMLRLRTEVCGRDEIAVSVQDWDRELIEGN